MAIFSGPSIAKTGLVFGYDMSNNLKSWKGAPATNLAAGAVAGGNALVTVTNVTDKLPDGTLGTVQESTALTGGDSNRTGAMGTYNVTTGTTYTLSFYVKNINCSGFGGNVYDTTVPGVIGSVTYPAITSDKWTRVINTFTVPATPVGTHILAPQYYRDGGYGTWRVCWFQLEVGSIATAYTNGTRSTTQALVDLTGNSTITASSATYTSDGTFSFNGVDNYISAPVLSLPTNITISVWVKRTGAVNYYSPIVEQGGARPFRFILHNGAMAFGNDGTVDAYYRANTATSDLNVWYNYVATFNGTCHIYVNGVEQLTTQSTGQYGPWGTSQLNIGYRPYTGAVSSFNGIISNTQIYNRALSATEIQQNFEAYRDRYSI